MARHHTEVRRFWIFALILGEQVFVGKTASPRISAVYSGHRCGRVAATRGIFDQEELPALHILEQVSCTGSDAYRHILAWIRLFEEAGYCCINHMATVVSSDMLYPPTEAILRKLKQEPINQILERTYIKRPSDGNIKPPRKILPPLKREKHVQMNLRMKAKDKRDFDRFCKEHHLKAREALGLLLDQMNGEDDHLLQLLSAQKVMRLENEKLKNQLAVWQGKALPAQEQKATEYLQFLKMGFTEYMQQLCAKDEETQLPAFPYKRFRKQSNIRYEYPETEGFLLLTAEAVLWGRNRARFIVGRGQSGEYLKVRYYSKPLYVGALIWDYPAGTKWLVGCRRAADGAMEVAAAFWMPSRMEQLEKTTIDHKPEQKISLDDQIYNALFKTRIT